MKVNSDLPQRTQRNTKDHGRDSFVSLCVLCGKKKEKGSILIFSAGFFVPLLMLLSSLLIDLHGYTLAQSDLQTLVDNAAVYGTRYLPAQQKTADAVIKYINSNATVPVTTESIVKGDTVTVSLNASYTPAFATFFGESAAESLSLPINVFAAAKNGALDIYVGFDRSSYLAPELSGSESDDWGVIGEWGASYVATKYLSDIRIDPRVATQQCFNKKFNSLKSAALTVFDYFSSFPSGRTALSYFPGAGTQYGIIKTLSGNSASFTGQHIDWDTSTYVTVTEDEALLNFPLQSIHCAAIAENETEFRNYLLPRGKWSPISVSSNNQKLIDLTNWSLNTSYPLTPDDVLWSRVVNRQQEMDVVQMLGAVTQSLLYSSTSSGRGNLVRRSPSAVFIFAGDLPRYNGIKFEDNEGSVKSAMRIALDDMKTRWEESISPPPFTIYYITIGGSDNGVNNLSDFLKDQKETSESGGSFEMKVIRTTNPEALFSNLIGPLLLQQQRGMLVS